jgi:hypothetical protein
MISKKLAREIADVLLEHLIPTDAEAIVRDLRKLKGNVSWTETMALVEVTLQKLVADAEERK